MGRVMGPYRSVVSDPFPYAVYGVKGTYCVDVVEVSYVYAVVDPGACIELMTSGDEWLLDVVGYETRAVDH